MQKPEGIYLTVILLTYNHEKFISQAIASVLSQQTNFQYEIVIIEDFSTDSTREIVQDYKQRYPEKIKLILADSNKNDNVAWAQAIKSSQAKYIALLDGDDYWLSPLKLQNQVDFLDKNTECSACFHSSRHIYEDSSLLPYDSRSPQNQKRFKTKDLLLVNFIPTCSTVFRHNYQKGFPNWFYGLYASDTVTHLLNSQHGDIGYIDEVLGVTRIHSSGAWNGMNEARKLEVLIQDYEIIEANLKGANTRLMAEQISKFYFDLAQENLSQGHSKKAKIYLFRSVQKYFFNSLISKKSLLKLILQAYYVDIYNFIIFKQIKKRVPQ
jgi:glycosyltransferase involved in cell wall biosynthesis